MQVRPFSIFPAMLYYQNAKIIVFQPRPCRPLEALDDFFDLFFRRLVLRRKGDHGRRITISVVQAVHQVGKKFRVTPPYNYLFGLSFP
jgi:hypothetical protein